MNQHTLKKGKEYYARIENQETRKTINGARKYIDVVCTLFEAFPPVNGKPLLVVVPGPTDTLLDVLFAVGVPVDEAVDGALAVAAGAVLS